MRIQLLGSHETFVEELVDVAGSTEVFRGCETPVDAIRDFLDPAEVP